MNGRAQHKFKTPVLGKCPPLTRPRPLKAVWWLAPYSLVVSCALESLNAPVKKSLTKPKYTEFSGYNLVASVPRKEKHIAAVVLGGNSRARSDARMSEPITRYRWRGLDVRGSI